MVWCHLQIAYVKLRGIPFESKMILFWSCVKNFHADKWKAKRKRPHALCRVWSFSFQIFFPFTDKDGCVYGCHATKNQKNPKKLNTQDLFNDVLPYCKPYPGQAWQVYPLFLSFYLFFILCMVCLANQNETYSRPGGRTCRWGCVHAPPQIFFFLLKL